MMERLGNAIAARVADGCVIGVGTGTTVDAALDAIGERVRREGLRVSVVPTSLQSGWRCAELGLHVLTPCTVGPLEWGFDGADAIDGRRRLIKGRGGAMLQEKILAQKCLRYIVIADEAKMVADLASSCPIPVEVVPEARGIVEQSLRSLGATEVTLRSGSGKHGPVITEAGNLIFDCRFSQVLDDLEGRLKALVGVVETGLFLSQAHEVLLGSDQGVRSL